MKCQRGHLLLLAATTLCVLLLANESGIQCSELGPEEVPANAVEPLTERLVKQSNLLAEESRVEGAAVSIVEPPRHFQAASTTSTRDNQHHTGGPGDTYISMASDGSSRYRFGFDTKQATTAAGSGGAPRLMREESRLEDGTVVGRYGYTDPFGVFRIVQYVAGPEGYFASEHVGAISGDSAASDKMQLNKQLRNAIELARRRRLASDAAAAAAASQHPQHQQRHTRDSSTGQATSTVTFSTSINHIVGSNGRSYSTAFRPNKPRASSLNPASKLRLAEPHREPIEMSHQRLAAPLAPPVYQSSRTRHGETLRASDAWSVLSNTYSEQESPLIINHGAPRPAADTAGDAAVAARVIPATTHTSELGVGNGFEQEFGKQAEKLASLQKETTINGPSISEQPAAVFGARSVPPQQVYLSPVSDLNPPLYHPEVHMAELYQQTAPHPAQDTYADTVTAPTQVLSSSQSSAAVRGAQLTRRDGHVHEHPVRYATRLSALATLRQQYEGAEPRDDELSVEASEQVSTNTSSSRARMPDRSKKLSAILKPRNHAVAGDDKAKIKRPTPLNMKRQNMKAASHTPESSTQTAPKLQEPLLESTTRPTLIKSTNLEKKFGKQTKAFASGTTVVPPELETELANNSSTTEHNSSSGITLIDTIQSKADLIYDKELYEKIVRIQQEIAAKNLASTAPSEDASVQVSSSKPETVSNSTADPITTSPLAAFSTPREASLAQTTTIATTTSTELSNSTSFVAQYVEPAAKKDEQQVKKNNTLGEHALPTGPLLVMDSYIDQDELMANFTLDNDPFDSTRGSTSATPIIVQPDEPAAKTDEFHLGNHQSAPTSNLSRNTTTQFSSSTTGATVDTTTTYLYTGNASNPTTELPLVMNNRITTMKQFVSDATTTSAPATTTKTSPTTSIGLTEIISPSSTTTTTTTTVQPSTTKSPPESTTQETVLSSTTSTTTPPTTTTILPIASDTSNTTISSTTTSSTSTSTSASTSTSTSTSTQSPTARSTFGQPRFGRLVIKREGKVVARYNGTEPIPDSLIPIGTGLVGGGASSGEALIVPDMPRLSMRRAVKRKAGSLLRASVNNLTTTNTATDSTSSTTKDPLLSEASEWSPVRKSFKRRGTRSSTLNSKDSMELVASEAVKSPEIKLSEQQNNETKAKRFTSYTRARSWSARIRGNPIPPAPAANMSYEPKEDLRKMVDKIEKRLMSSQAASGSTSKQSSVQITSTTTPTPAHIANQTSRQSKSSSASFTIPLSITPSAATAIQSVDDGTQQFSPNENIQLRHNQSLTVHVDIDPPGRQQSTAVPVLVADNRVSKRLVSRDTQAFVGNPRDNDMLRLAKSTSSLTSEQTVGKTPALSRTVQEIKEATMRRKRNPRMLCIEVDAGASLQ